ncbi:MAG: hypothetical protein PHG27_03255 [Massilibacteroides sp.]|nr:hypothetical protein [Massilibacteroides sp.]MDD4114605.1 hypothetical protein [Massilibacteroides sp.]
MKHTIIILLLLGLFSCSKNENNSSEEVRNILLLHQWELKDTIYYIGSYDKIYDQQILEFFDEIFKLTQKSRIFRADEEKIVDSLELEIEGTYKIENRKIVLESEERRMSGRLSDDKIVINSSENPIKELYFYQK